MPTNTLLLELQARREQVKDLQKEIEELKKDLKMVRYATSSLLPYTKKIAYKIPTHVKLAVMLAIDENLDED